MKKKKWSFFKNGTMPLLLQKQPLSYSFSFPIFDCKILHFETQPRTHTITTSTMPPKTKMGLTSKLQPAKHAQNFTNYCNLNWANWYLCTILGQLQCLHCCQWWGALVLCSIDCRRAQEGSTYCYLYLLPMLKPQLPWGQGSTTDNSIIILRDQKKSVPSWVWSFQHLAWLRMVSSSTWQPEMEMSEFEIFWRMLMYLEIKLKFQLL